MNLYILQKFNNYSDRKIIGYQTLTNYLNYSIGSAIDVNFNPNDGKYTNQVVMCDFDTLGYPDYLIVCDENNNIISRWFVLNTTRERRNKWRLDLKHDLVYDNIAGIMNNDNTLIKKGYAPITSPAVFNKEEDFFFNQIKVSESYLKYYNNTGGFDCFLIAYLPKTWGTQDFEIELKKDVKLILPRASANYVNTWETSDAPYDIYGIPFKSWWIGEIPSEMLKYKVVRSDGTDITSCQTYGVDGINISEIFKIFSLLGVYAYDVQVIPFTSIDNNNVYVDEENLACKLDYTALPSAYYDSNIQIPIIKTYGTTNNEVYSIPLVNIPKSIFNLNLTSNAIPLEQAFSSNVVKMCQEDKYRLVSPDYSSAVEIDKSFNFKLKNDGNNDYLEYGYPEFNIHCKLQPIQPYIYIEPVYSGMNGYNYIDNRGMLCNYNFSITQTSDKWAEFLLNNKNYLNTFNQEVKNFEIKRTQAIVGGVVNTLGSATQGAAAGSLAGGGAGAAVGAAAGVIQGVYNTYENVYNINRALGNYKRSFKWSCENIQAMPSTLNKISTLVNSNKIFPIIEKYTCLDEEKTNFGKYLYLNGQTINMVGKMYDYWGGIFFPYMEAVIMRIDNSSRWNGLTADMLNEINIELEAGLFFEVRE